jgi:GDPmannose 4,6-dehydratase
MMKALIFGSNGQDGFYIKELLKNAKIDTIGISRKNADVIGEVQDQQLVERIIRKNIPNYIFHFAADSTTSHQAIWENHEAISTGTLNILEAVKEYSPGSKVFLSGSGLQFENRNIPINENARFVSTSPYVISRNHSVYAARYYRSLGFKIYVGYFFNHDSPRRSPRHVAQKIINYIKNIDSEKGKLLLGDIEVRKEWTFAGDTVQGIWTLINQDKIFECNIGSGLAYSIEDWLSICFEYINLDWRNYVIVDKEFVSDYRILVSDPNLIMSLGWKPKISIEELARMMISNGE